MVQDWLKIKELETGIWLISSSACFQRAICHQLRNGRHGISTGTVSRQLHRKKIFACSAFFFLCHGSSFRTDAACAQEQNHLATSRHHASEIRECQKIASNRYYAAYRSGTVLKTGWLTIIGASLATRRQIRGCIQFTLKTYFRTFRKTLRRRVDKQMFREWRWLDRHWTAPYRSRA